MKEQKDSSSDIAKISFTKRIIKERPEELTETSHTQLLSEAFNALTKELDKNGNTAKLKELRKEHSLKLIRFWQNKIKIYQEAQKQGLVREGETYSLGNETISVVALKKDGVPILEIKRQTKTENDKVQIIAEPITWTDKIAFLPTIKSEIKSDPEKTPNIYYKVDFRKDGISNFDRSFYHMDPNLWNSWVEDTRHIVC